MEIVTRYDDNYVVVEFRKDGYFISQFRFTKEELKMIVLTFEYMANGDS